MTESIKRIEIKHIVCGIVLTVALAVICSQYKVYQNHLDESSALKFELDIRDQQISEMEGDLESAYGEFEFNFGESSYGTERDNQKIIQKELGGKIELRLDDGTRVDLVLGGSNKRAIEIDWDKKWAEGVGQATYYMMKLNDIAPESCYLPMVILLAKGADSGWEKYRDRVEFCKMRCWVFDTETKTWLDKED